MLLPHVGRALNDPVPGAEIDGAEQDPFRIATADPNLGLLTTQGPGSAQDWEESHHRLIFKEQHCLRRHLL